MRANNATVRFWDDVLAIYTKKNAWDVRLFGLNSLTTADFVFAGHQQEVVSNFVRGNGSRQVDNWPLNGKEHWWYNDAIGMKIFMLPLTQVPTICSTISITSKKTHLIPLGILQFLPYHVVGLNW